MKPRHTPTAPADALFDLILEIAQGSLEVLRRSVMDRVRALSLQANVQANGQRGHTTQLDDLIELHDRIGRLQRTITRVRPAQTIE